MIEDEGSGDLWAADDSFRILLVEDNYAHAALIMRAFERLGLSGKIDWVKDGKAALDYLYEREIADETALPKLVMLDLRLPKLDGHEVLREMKRSESLRVIPVVVLTTSTSDYDLKTAYSNYVNSYLTKPLSFDDLQKTIEDVKNYWFKLNRYPKPA